MTITVTPLGTQYEALAAWTGEPVEDVRRQVEDDHEEQRDHWIAWRDGGVVGRLPKCGLPPCIRRGNPSSQRSPLNVWVCRELGPGPSSRAGSGAHLERPADVTEAADSWRQAPNPSKEGE
jgi:hypothetical protein